MKIIMTFITFLYLGALVAGDSAKQEVSPVVKSDKQNDLGKKARSLLWQKGDCPEEVIQLVKQGLNPHYRQVAWDCFQQSLLQIVAYQGHVKTLKCLVRHGVDIGAREEAETDSVIWDTVEFYDMGGTENRRVGCTMAEFLIDHGADLYATSQDNFRLKGNTLFMYACSGKNYKPGFTDLLLKKDSSVAPSPDMYSRETKQDAQGNPSTHVSFEKWEYYLLKRKRPGLTIGGDENFTQTTMKRTEENFNKYYTIDADGKVAKKI